MTPTLMISYEAPPRLSASAILMAKELKALAETSSESPVIDLVCASPGTEVPSDPSLEKMLPDTIRVHHLDPVARGRKTLLQRIIGGLGGWQQAAVIKGGALFPAEHKKPAWLYSRSHPPASHLAALELIEGPLQGVPWAAHFTEPWSQHPYYKSHMTRAALRRFEQQIFAAATRLIFATPELRDSMLAGEDSILMEKARVVPHLFDPALFTHAQASPPAEFQNAQTGVKSIAHVGHFSEFRSPGVLLDAMATLQDLHPGLSARYSVWLVGAKIEPPAGTPAADVAAPANARLSGSVPYLESLGIMKAADVLLTIEGPALKNVFFPAKLVDYLGAGKPLFAIAPRDSLTAKLMESWKQPWCDVSDLDAIAAVLKRVAEGDLWAPPAQSVAEIYSAANVGRELARCLAELIPAQSNE